MRDLAEKLFNTRCGVMVEKVKSITNYNNTRGGWKGIQTMEKQGVMVEKVRTYWSMLNFSLKTLYFQEDIAHVELKSVSGGDTVFTKSIFVRFNDLDLRWFCISIKWDLQSTFFKLSQSVHGHCGDISALKFWNFFINLLSPPPGWEYGQTKAMQRRTR